MEKGEKSHPQHTARPALRQGSTPAHLQKFYTFREEELYRSA